MAFAFLVKKGVKNTAPRLYPTLSSGVTVMKNKMPHLTSYKEHFTVASAGFAATPSSKLPLPHHPYPYDGSVRTQATFARGSIVHFGSIMCDLICYLTTDGTVLNSIGVEKFTAAVGLIAAMVNLYNKVANRKNVPERYIEELGIKIKNELQEIKNIGLQLKTAVLGKDWVTEYKLQEDIKMKIEVLQKNMKMMEKVEEKEGDKLEKELVDNAEKKMKEKEGDELEKELVDNAEKEIDEDEFEDDVEKDDYDYEVVIPALNVKLRKKGKGKK